MKVIKNSIRFVCLIPVYFYKFCISPILPHTCRFYPTCSSYAVMAIKEFGVFKGSKLAFQRILSCNPKNENCGYNPLPINIKGEIKWLM